MGSSVAFFATLLVVGGVAVNAAKVFKVGSYGGEGNYTLYKNRASSHRFHIIDSLILEYKEGDSAMVLDKLSFYHCSVTHQIAEFTNGSGADNHCKNGQRLLVEVIHPKSPSAFANPP